MLLLFQKIQEKLCFNYLKFQNKIMSPIKNNLKNNNNLTI
jgi:hypothetical protein